MIRKIKRSVQYLLSKIEKRFNIESLKIKKPLQQKKTCRISCKQGHSVVSVFQSGKCGRSAEDLRGAGQNLRGSRGAVTNTVPLGVQHCITQG